MSKKSFIDSVEVKTPCTEDWNEMTGTDTVRFCSHCSKHVNNLSEMTRKQAARLVRSSDGIRYIADPRTRRPMFADQLLQITRRAPSVAAGVMTASIALSTHAYTQGGVEPSKVVAISKASPSATAEKAASKDDILPRKFSGTILDPNGAVIVAAQLTLVSVQAAKTVSVISDGNGHFSLSNLPSGTYQVEVEASGFATTLREVAVSDSKDTTLDISMEVGGPALTVDIVLDPSELVNVISGGIGFIEYGTPLARAVASDDLDEVRDLLVKGADPNGKDENYDKVTPLFMAVENGSVEMVQLLINFGAKVNARDGSKQTPLMRLDGDATAELVELLVRYDAKVDLADKAGNTALILAAGNADAEVVKALIDAGADVRAKNKAGQTALMEAANYDDLATVKLLLEAGSEVNAKNKEGETAWDLASEEEIEQLLVRYGAIVSVEDEEKPDGDS